MTAEDDAKKLDDEIVARVERELLSSTKVPWCECPFIGGHRKGCPAAPKPRSGSRRG